MTVQSVPPSVAVGPDGALYVGELTGYPFGVGKARIWRVVPGQAGPLCVRAHQHLRPRVRRQGSARARDRLAGLLNLKSPGALIRLAPNGKRTVILSTGLVAPTGLAISDGSIYISNDGTSPATGPGHHGEIVSFPVDATSGTKPAGVERRLWLTTTRKPPAHGKPALYSVFLRSSLRMFDYFPNCPCGPLMFRLSSARNKKMETHVDDDQYTHVLRSGQGRSGAVLARPCRQQAPARVCSTPR